VGNELALGKDLSLYFLLHIYLCVSMDIWPPSNKFGRNPFKSYGDYEFVRTDTILRERVTLRLAAVCLPSCSSPDILTYVNKSKALAASEG